MTSLSSLREANNQPSPLLNRKIHFLRRAYANFIKLRPSIFLRPCAYDASAPWMAVFGSARFLAGIIKNVELPV
jgi:hypothetical protein